MSWKLPPLNALKAFESAARLGTMTAAGDELNVTQVAITRQIAALEASMRVSLFVREHRSIRLTKAGETLFVAVTRSFHELQSATESMSEGSAIVLKICGYATFTMRWLIPRLHRFHNLHPHIDIQLHSSMDVVDFERSDIDVAIRGGDGQWPAWDCVLLAPIELVPVCSPGRRAALKSNRFPGDLARVTLLHSKARPHDWRKWLEAVSAPTDRARTGITFDNGSLAYQAAIDGAGVAMAQHVLVADDLAKGSLVALSGVKIPSGDNYYFVAPRRRMPAKAVAFRDWLLKEIRQG
ncbi:LysR substrate-binding domain-containing protein [Hydrogenophaga sp.]|uniref:LysR substrate-binding domain-containing protein n=1 Tax=Hydrogenophaga sp. TaxID=1904254 RepID=UPI003F708861